MKKAKMLREMENALNNIKTSIPYNEIIATQVFLDTWVIPNIEFCISELKRDQSPKFEVKTLKLLPTIQEAQ